MTSNIGFYINLSPGVAPLEAIRVINRTPGAAGRTVWNGAIYIDAPDRPTLVEAMDALIRAALVDVGPQGAEDCVNWALDPRRGNP